MSLAFGSSGGYKGLKVGLVDSGQRSVLGDNFCLTFLHTCERGSVFVVDDRLLLRVLLKITHP